MMHDTKSISPDTMHRWKRPSFIKNPLLRYGFFLFIALYLVYAFSTLSLDLERIMRGIPRAQQIFSSAFPPNFASRG